MNDITEKLLEIVSDWDGKFKGAYNIRENSGCAGRQSSENIRIESKTDNPGINIFISSKAQQAESAVAVSYNPWRLRNKCCRKLCRRIVRSEAPDSCL